MTTATPDTTITLRELPVTINVSAMAQGLLDMFTEEEKTVLRFGMLPAARMEAVERSFRERFNELGRHPKDVWPQSLIAHTEYGPACRVSMVHGEVTEWSIDKLVSEAMREVTLAIYAIGDLVV